MRTLHAEWTKFRTVRGWVLGAVGAALASVLFLLVGTASSNQGAGADAALPAGPGGEAVNDSFSFLHTTVTGDGSLTVPVTSLTGILADPDAGPSDTVSGLTPWSKAGIILKTSLTQGSSYAAVMATAAHGVRMQHDFVHDRAGDVTGTPSPATPQWLRLVRTGTTVTGYDSTDGVHWTEIGTAEIAGTTLQVGLFVTAPATVDTANASSAPATASATFGQPTLTGAWNNDGWSYTQVGNDAGTSGSYVPTASGSYRANDDGFTITGAGDIAPVVGGPALGPAFTVETFLIGTFVCLLVLSVVAVQFGAGEYRRGLLTLTLTATPRRGRVVAAKAIVVTGVAFVVGVGAAAASLALGQARASAAHFAVLTVPPTEQVRAVLGTGLLLAATTLLALSLGVVLRRSAAAIAAVATLVVVPYVLAMGGMLPTDAAQWLLRLTPAAGFAIQQTLSRYAHVLSVYTPATGYFPLPPWAGLAVLGAWTLALTGLAWWMLRRRNA
ncbi:DUF1349 domain-containing protein [Jiangella alkaliphila]|uniref:ABC-type transport system involved in multi-copper enzyme maturation, permease component n=1 Tax=Jiangella alkaliphila TaxID=419479 RepID=A0A1H2KBV0_9ACTN|nr:ABC transporter permease subunit [Jiangella alkaliphila]SDU65836.1 ABC-type transport system involved in multi-copper enzyme maturation, permease component [Jiangella alkaliphila]